MYNYSKDGITVSSILDDRKENKNGSYPVKIRVTFKRVRKYYSTGKMLSVDDWGRLPNTRSHELGEIRKDIENSFSLVKANVIALAEKGEFTFDALNVRLSRNAGDTINAASKSKLTAF